MKNVIILLSVILCSNEILGQFNIVRNFLENVVDNVTKVRTPDKRERRWRELAVLDFIGLVEQYDGYTAEGYDVQTADGYILKLHRITGSPFSPKAYGKPPVFLGHGLFASSDQFVVLGPEHALAFLLADAGYDVWIGNFRGNTYSKRHIKYSTSGSNYKFWNFSMDEMSLIDLPLFIDTVLEKTDKKRLIYVGYSMGATLSYILLSSKPEYNDRMNLVFNIAPVGIFVQPLNQLLSMITILQPPLKSFFVARHIFQIQPQSKQFQILGKIICGTEEGAIVCKTLLKMAGRIDRVNPKVYPLLFPHAPAGTSFNTVDHYCQMIKSGKFRFYDYGVATNRVKYDADSPPEYNLSQITSPQAILYAENDAFAGSRATKTLKSRLPNVVAFVAAPRYFNHIDFVLNAEARNATYYNLLEIIRRYS